MTEFKKSRIFSRIVGVEEAMPTMHNISKQEDEMTNRFGSSNGRRAPEGTRHIGSTTLGVGASPPEPRPKNISEWLNKGSSRDHSSLNLKPLAQFGLNFTETDTDGNIVPREPTDAEICAAVASRDAAKRARTASIPSGNGPITLA